MTALRMTAPRRGPVAPRVRKPSPADLKAAHRFAFDRLRWTLEIVESDPPKLKVVGDPDFEAYRIGTPTATVQDRALVDIVQAIVARVDSVKPTFLRIIACGGLAEDASPWAKRMMLDRYRRFLRTRMLSTISVGGPKGLAAYRDRRPVLPIVGPKICVGSTTTNDGWFADLGLVEPVAPTAPLKSRHEDVDLPDFKGPPSPSVAAIKKAVKYVFSDCAAFEAVPTDRASFRFKARGNRKFQAYLAGRWQRTEADKARTAVAKAVENLLGQFDEAVMRGYFPNKRADEFRAPAMRRFAKERVRAQIDAAINKDGYVGLQRLATSALNPQGEILDDGSPP